MVMGAKISTVDTDTDTHRAFTAWDVGAPWVKATVYQAATDGFVLAKIPGDPTMTIAVDTFTPPTTVRVETNARDTLVCPVAKNEYWQIVTGQAPTIYWKGIED